MEINEFLARYSWAIVLSLFLLVIVFMASGIYTDLKHNPKSFKTTKINNSELFDCENQALEKYNFDLPSCKFQGNVCICVERNISNVSDLRIQAIEYNFTSTTTTTPILP